MRAARGLRIRARADGSLRLAVAAATALGQGRGCRHFRQLLDEVRQALAEELLATGGLTLEEIAERLGYGEVSNFIHAFKRWKGVAPRRFQRGA